MNGYRPLISIDPPPPRPPTKVTIVGKHEIYMRKNLIGPFLVHKLLGPRPPPPPPWEPLGHWVFSVTASPILGALHALNRTQTVPGANKGSPVLRAGYRNAAQPSDHESGRQSGRIQAWAKRCKAPQPGSCWAPRHQKPLVSSGRGTQVQGQHHFVRQFGSDPFQALEGLKAP